MHAPDVIVVGGGVVGCAVAFALARERVSVTLLERDVPGAHASGAAAGMLAPISEAELPGPRLAWGLRSLALFPELARELEERSGIDPQLVIRGVLRVARSEEEARVLRDRVAALDELGVEWLDTAECRELEPGLAEGLPGALHVPCEGQVGSSLLTRALARAAEQLGARVECASAVLGLVSRAGRVLGVRTAGGERTAACVVLCAGSWTPALAASVQPGAAALPITPLRGQILALEPRAASLRKIVWGGSVYLVPRRDGSVVVGATEEHAGFDCRVTAAGIASLLAEAPRLVPALSDAGFRQAWAGLRPATPDRLPLIGALPGVEGLLLAAGHHRSGVLLSPVTARLVTDAVLGKGLPEEAAVFRPERFLRAA